MPNKNIFCNTPWYELHVYWDGSLGICCNEDHKLYSNTKWNIKDVSISEWFNSEPVRQFRMALLGDQRHSACARCYFEEDYSGNSRRFKSNQKSAIFTQQAFDPSYTQSPGHRHFEHSALNQGHTVTHPVDMHIDLGNYCNLACKMCSAKASSRIASQEVAWGISSSRPYLGTDWTKNNHVWQSFLDQLIDIPNLQNIHFMGGETLLTDRFEQLVDFFILHGRFDVCFSFVTNGTVWKPNLISKLTQFQRTGIEISLETTDQRNAYIRQGTNTEQVLKNINGYIDMTNGSSVTVALRPAPSALSVGSFHTVLNLALQHQLVVKSNLCYDPKFLDIKVLPAAVKLTYKNAYQKLLDQLPRANNQDFNASDPNNYQLIVREQAQMIMDVLCADDPDDIEQLQSQLVAHCRRWDSVFGLSAKQCYPELEELWCRYGY